MPQTKAPEDVPTTSFRDRARQRALEFRSDMDAQAGASELLPLAISFIITLFISFLLFGILGPDANEICTDTTNFTAEECDNATQARLLFWVFLVIVGVVHILIAIGIAKKSV